MEKLTKQQLDHLKQLLDAREQVLREDIQREIATQEDPAQIASEVPDPGDASFASLVTDLGNAALSRDVDELRAIEAARLRMANGVYNECTKCGFEIPYQRLEAQPTAQRCAPCQDMYEKTHAGAAGGGTL